MSTTKQKTIKLSSIKPNPNNPRLIKDDKFFKLVESIKTFGEKMMPLRPIVIDENNIILGGNMRFKALKELEYKEVPDDWIKAAKDLTEEQKKEFIVKDNVGFGNWDFDVLANEWDTDLLEGWGLDMPDWEMENFEGQENEYDNEYSRKIESPNYEPSENKPNVTELYNLDKYKNLITDIENSSVPSEIKEFLKICASRHIVFNYSNIADFYSHSDKNTQELMEDSALIIIDFKKAIEQGFVKLSEEISNEYLKEYPE